MFHVKKIMFHVANDFRSKFFDRVNLSDSHYNNTTENGGFKMKKLLVLMMTFAMILSLMACAGNEDTSTESTSTPAQVEEAEFTEEQQALAQEFLKMAEEFDAVADKVNASSELLSNEELVTAMNDLSNEIIKADEYFTSPETLTPEIMGALTVAIDVGRTFIAEASAALDEIE